MTPSEVEGLARVIETLVKTFGIGAVPVAMALWIFVQSRKSTPDAGAGVAGELRSDVKKVIADMADMNVKLDDLRIKVAVVETKLEERRE